MKKITGLLMGFLLVSSVTLSCPDKNFHNQIQSAIQKSDGIIRISGKSMYIKTGILKAFAASEKDYHDSLLALLLYCTYHDLKVVEI